MTEKEGNLFIYWEQMEEKRVSLSAVAVFEKCREAKDDKQTNKHANLLTKHLDVEKTPKSLIKTFICD